MSNLVPKSPTTEVVPSVGVGLSALAGTDRRTSRALSTVQRNTLVRMASVQAHTIVQNEKLHEIDRLTREAMSGQAMLSRWAATLAQGDPFLADDLKFFSDVAKMGKGEIIADTISDFCREGRQ
jgi:hypothetical protein